MISKLQANRVRRSYLGGSRIDAFCGEGGECSQFPMPIVDNPPAPRPEDWLASTTQAFNGTQEIEGEGLGRLEDGRLVRDAVGALPILVKLLDSDERLVVQAHPTVPCAERLFHSPVGKTECWYFLPDTAPDACVYLGFKPGVTRTSWEQAVRECSQISNEQLPIVDNPLLSFLHRIPVAPGDFVFVDGGVPHAIGGGCFMVELQEPSDLMVVAERFTPSGRRIPDSKMHGGAGWERMFDVYEYEGLTYEETCARYVRKCSQSFANDNCPQSFANPHCSQITNVNTNLCASVPLCEQNNPVNPVPKNLCASVSRCEQTSRICGPEFTDKFEMWRLEGGGSVALGGAPAVVVVTEGGGSLNGLPVRRGDRLVATGEPVLAAGGSLSASVCFRRR